MAGARIGALHFVLGADTAAFERNLKAAETSLKRVAVVGAAIGTVIANAITGAASAIGRGVAQALEDADKLHKASQQIGVTVEQLSALRFSADLSGVSLEALTQSMVRLSRAMAEAATNSQSNAGRVFATIGVSATDAVGRLRPVQDVLLDLADKFAGWRDGAEKAAIATAIFGRSGAQLIPFLNQGREGIAATTAEAERLGLIVSSRTAKAAEEFNDSLRKLTLASQGLFTKIAELLLPTMQRAVEMFSTWLQESRALQLALGQLEVVFKTIVTAVVVISTVIETAIAAFLRLVEAAKAAANLDWEGVKRAFTGAFDDISQRARTAADDIRRIWTETQNLANGFGKLGNDTGRVTAPLIASGRSVAESMRAARDEARALLDSVVNAPTETFVNKMRAIEQALRDGTITMRQFGDMTRRVQKENQQHMLDLGTATATALTTIFGKNKTAAIAAAIINTAVGITRALATLPPPFSWAQAALIAATGAAQIATIRSTSQSSSGNAPSVSGGGGGSAEPAQQMPSQTLTVQGISPGDIFTGDAVRTLAERLLEHQRNGGKVVLV